MRVPGGGVTQNPFGTSWVGAQKEAESVQEQLQQSLFGGKKPEVLEVDDALTDRLMAEMHVYRKKLARLAGDEPKDYELALARGTIAMIDERGTIYLGKDFLLAHAEDRACRVGVLAHEIGHRPKRWEEYRAQRPLDKAALEDLCRLEETRADYFAGHALAQLDLECEPLCAFLAIVEEGPHPEYFPAPLRAKTIREGFEVGRRREQNLQKFFPELARARSAKGDLGSG